MPTQKTFKQRIRARMTKTGESYTAARHQLLHKSGALESQDPDTTDAAVEPADTSALLTSEESMVRGSGRGHDDWFALLDAWGGTEHRHAEIAAWLQATHGVNGWWAQNITVSYERARGMRARHQVTGGFSVSVTRTVGADADTALAAFTDATVRGRWLPVDAMRQRPTRAARTARFDWSEPASRVVVIVAAKATGTAVNVTHEKLPDAATADRLKAAWRTWLDDLKRVIAST